MSKLLLTALAAIVLAAPAFAQSPAAPNSTPDGSNIDVVVVPGSGAGYGVYIATTPNSTAAETVTLNIAPYSHVGFTDNTSGARTANVDPGGSGGNRIRVNNKMTYGTNRAVGGNTVDLAVTSSTPNAFDELNIIIRKPGVRQILDIATAGSAGSVADGTTFTAANNAARPFITGFGQAVASINTQYDFVVSDVALEGTRVFDFTFTVSPF